MLKPYDWYSLRAADGGTAVPSNIATYRAAVRAATQLVSNPQLAQLLAQDEAKSRAACMEYECDMADHSFLGHEHGTRYRSFRPYLSLRR